jgi:hypothetical protein
MECGGRRRPTFYQDFWRRRFGSPQSGGTGKTPAIDLVSADTSAPRGAKAASPVGLIRHRPPSAAALHKRRMHGSVTAR